MFAEKANIPPKGILLFALPPGSCQKVLPFEVTRGFRNVTTTASAMASFPSKKGVWNSLFEVK